MQRAPEHELVMRCGKRARKNGELGTPFYFLGWEIPYGDVKSERISFLGRKIQMRR